MTPRRVTISIPEDVARIVERMENVSAFFTDAARQADRRTRLSELLDNATRGDQDALKRARIRARMHVQMAQADVRRLEQPRSAEEISEIVAQLLSDRGEDVQRAAAEQVWRARRAA